MIFELTESSFSKQVEDKVRKNNCEYMEAVVELCDELSIEPKLAAKHLSKPIIEKIEVEGTNNNLLPKKTKLPF